MMFGSTCENFNSHFLFFYIFSVASQTKFFFFFLFFKFIIYLFYFKSRMALFIWGFGLSAAGIPGLDFWKNIKKKSSANKLHRADSSSTAYDWFSILQHGSYWTRNCSDFQSKIEVQRSSEFGILALFVLFRQTIPSSRGRRANN